MNLNKVFIIGNLTRDPELRALPSGAAVANLGVATNRVWKDQQGNKQEEVEFHNVVVFGRQAEIVKQYLAKGRSIFIEGRIRTRSWDAPDGAKKNRTEIIAERIQFGPRPAGQSASQGEFNAGQNQQNQKPSPRFADEAGIKEELPQIDIAEGEIKAEDLPF